METTNASKTRYSAPAIVMHWVLGAALVAMLGFGTYMVGLPFSPEKLKLMNWHKWMGVSLLALSVVRLAWRITHPAPALPSSVQSAMPAWQLWAHKGTHVALYGLFFVVPLIGWAYSSAAGFPIVLFGQIPLPDLLSPDKALAEMIKPWHEITALSMAFLVVLHIAAALKHHFIDRDALLRRMSLRA